MMERQQIGRRSSRDMHLTQLLCVSFKRQLSEPTATSSSGGTRRRSKSSRWTIIIMIIILAPYSLGVCKPSEGEREREREKERERERLVCPPAPVVVVK